MSSRPFFWFLQVYFVMRDIALLHLILEEAGAKVTDIYSKDIEYHPSERSLEQNFTAIAANPAIHGKILDLIRYVNP